MKLSQLAWVKCLRRKVTITGTLPQANHYASFLSRQLISFDCSTRGLYFLTTNRNSPYARGKNFTTNTVFLEAEPIEAEAEDNEIDA